MKSSCLHWKMYHYRTKHAQMAFLCVTECGNTWHSLQWWMSAQAWLQQLQPQGDSGWRGSRKALGAVPISFIKPSSAYVLEDAKQALCLETSRCQDGIMLNAVAFKNQSIGKYEHSLFLQLSCPKDMWTRTGLGNHVWMPLAWWEAWCSLLPCLPLPVTWNRCWSNF